MIVELLQNVADYGDAQSFIASDVSRLVLITPHMIRIAFTRPDARPDGTPENRISGFIDVDVSRIAVIYTAILEAVPKLGTLTQPVTRAACKSH